MYQEKDKEPTHRWYITIRANQDEVPVTFESNIDQKPNHVQVRTTEVAQRVLTSKELKKAGFPILAQKNVLTLDDPELRPLLLSQLGIPDRSKETNQQT